jgi:transcriptional repressor NrdR
VDTRDAGDAVRRRRECEGCGNRFTTYERAETNVTVLKRDGRRERFDSRKLLGGLERAANKRPVSSEQLEALSASIAAAVRRTGPEVEASQIGDLAERGLAQLDPVSAIQFASVYRNLEDLDELEAVVRRYKDDPLPGADQLALEGEPDGDSGPSGSGSNIGLSPLGKSRRVAHTRRGHARQP